jgi:hypothetical protein
MKALHSVREISSFIGLEPLTGNGWRLACSLGLEASLQKVLKRKALWRHLINWTSGTCRQLESKRKHQMAQVRVEPRL